MRPDTEQAFTSLVASAIVRASDASGDHLTRVIGVLTEVFDHLGSIGGSITQFDEESSGHIRMLKLIEVGRWDAKQRAARDAYWKQPNHETDPFLAAYVEMGVFDRPLSAIRHELVSDADWYGSAHVQQFRKRAGMDSAIYCTIPAPFPGGEPRRGWSVNVNRPWKATPFTQEDKDRLHLVFLALLPWLERAWSVPQNPTQELLARLPLRLRKVLACLLAGDSEKQVARKLKLSQHTVHEYIKQLHARLRVRSRSELLVKAMGATARPG